MSVFNISHFVASDIEDNKDMITITNVSSRLLERDLYKAFNSVRVYNNLFHKTSRYSVTMYKFFALEFLYILETLEVNPSMYINVRKIQQIKTLLKEKTWLKNIDEKQKNIVDYKQLSDFKFDPLPHQTEFFEKFNDTVPRYNLRGLLLAAEPGSGKTFASLALARCVKTPRVIVVCPLNAVETVWLKSIKGKDSLYKKDEPTVWLASSGKEYKGEEIMLCHYEALSKLLIVVNKTKDILTTIIIDESHNLNEITSNRTQTFLNLCQITKGYIVLASGTPIKALASETVPLLRAMDPLFTEDVSDVFKKLYRGEATAMTEILKRRLNLISHKVGSKALGLEEPIFEYIKVKTDNANLYTLKVIGEDMKNYAKARSKELFEVRPEYEVTFNELVKQAEDAQILGRTPNAKESFAQYRGYVKALQNAHDKGTLRSAVELMKFCSKFEKDFIYSTFIERETKVKFKEAAVIVKYYKLKVQGECLGRILGRKRIEAYQELSKHIPYEDIIESTKKKTLIFTSFIEVVDEATKTLTAMKYKPLKVYGEHISELNKIVEKYRNDESANPLVATYSSLSTAVPLTMADTMIAINPPYREYIMKQAVARIHRIGATTRTRIFNMSLDTGEEPNISDRMLDIVQWSKEQSAAILNLEEDLDNPEADTEVLISGFIHENVPRNPVLPDLKISKPTFLKW